MIQEYRKLSAEKLGFIFYDNWYRNYQLNVYLKNGKFICNILDWQPDKDANQREMIEDCLIEQECSIATMRSKDSATFVIIKGSDKGHQSDKSKSVAFMKAFMEYIKSR